MQQYRIRARRSGFTIVELLIVIVVIAILATISIVAYNGIQNRARESVLKSALANAGKWMQAQNAETGSYPTSLSGFQGQSGVALSLSTTANGFCINGEMTSGNALAFRNESGSGIQQGLCSGAVIGGSESGINQNLVTNTDFSSGWAFSSSNNTGRTLNSRAGVTGDPYPTRPVLVIANSATTSVSYAIVSATGINYSAITDATSYTLSFYVRKVGAYPGGNVAIGIGNTANTSITIPYGSGGSIIPTDTWQKFTKTATATRKETGDQRIYVSTPNTAYTTSGWQLEFQGFEIRET